MKKVIYKHIILVFVVSVAAGILLGLLFTKCTGTEKGHSHHGEDTVYTCSMDPQVKQDHPGKCPICGMDLIPAGKGSKVENTYDPNAVMMSEEAVALANIETQIVGGGTTDKEIRLFGKIEPNQRLQQTQSAYVEGRIEALRINAVGDVVSKGQVLAVIYSPTLYAAEQELLTALDFPDGNQRGTLIAAAKEKLMLLNITSAQINEVIRKRKASPYMALRANTSGTVVEKSVNQGDYVRQGQPLLKIANLGKVWAVFQAYERDLAFIHKGATIYFTSEALPGKQFKGVVSFIDPVMNAQSRTAGVRLEIDNGSGVFKPEMILTGNVAANMKAYKNDIVVPKSAVLWTGKRSIVYVKDDTEELPVFLLRRVVLGPALADGYVVTEGLAEGEEIVTNGAFAIDASAQLAGKKSMMNE